MEKEATLLHLGETVEAKDQIDLCNFGFGGISPPTLLEGDIEFSSTWRRIINCSDSAMTIMRIKTKTKQTQTRIVEVKNTVPEVVMSVLS